MVQKEGMLLFPVGKGNCESTTDGDDKLTTMLVGVSSSAFSTRHIVDPIDAGDIERNVFRLFNESEIAPLVENFWEVDDFSDAWFVLHCLINKGCWKGIGSEGSALRCSVNGSV